jgi:SAM-dependent methyltransferase
MEEWWRDPRSHFGELSADSPLLSQRADLQPAIEFICTDLALPAHARILDLGCGPGRYVVELAHEGFEVVGLDLHEPYLALARELAEREKVRAEFLAGDMREIPFDHHFDAVINVGTSFGLFDEADNRRVIEQVARALKPDGAFLLEMANRDYYLKHFTDRDWHRRADGRLVILRREFDYVRSRTDTYFEKLSPGEPENWSSSWRAYTLAEMVALLKSAGLVLTGAFGDWKQSKYSVDTPRMVLVSKKEGVG